MGRYQREVQAPGFRHTAWHGWWSCLDCGTVVENWGVHSRWHADLEELLACVPGGEDGSGSGLEDLAERANREGHAVVQASAWLGGLRQAREVFRLRHTQAAR